MHSNPKIFYFGLATQLARFQFPRLGLKLGPSRGTQISDHSATRELSESPHDSCRTTTVNRNLSPQAHHWTLSLSFSSCEVGRVWIKGAQSRGEEAGSPSQDTMTGPEQRVRGLEAPSRPHYIYNRNMQMSGENSPDGIFDLNETSPFLGVLFQEFLCVRLPLTRSCLLLPTVLT